MPLHAVDAFHTSQSFVTSVQKAVQWCLWPSFAEYMYTRELECLKGDMQVMLQARPVHGASGRTKKWQSSWSCA
jgi:hypothetical protein